MLRFVKRWSGFLMFEWLAADTLENEVTFGPYWRLWRQLLDTRLGIASLLWWVSLFPFTIGYVAGGTSAVTGDFIVGFVLAAVTLFLPLMAGTIYFCALFLGEGFVLTYRKLSEREASSDE